ncbi:SRPBCC domain-containing protein [Phenylobacterium sp.]|uniref:SRPBCC domain-containing protein n=1 Tax=Phenylobacterium sp. TaxID=1871053 RepID=UPI00120A3D1D|nr:SRPBCC domain-containing protein [Phenylobacterium sp.]THD60869.1 MAG: polyketide cyclase [Phenylobacterium sp.]
MTESAVIHDTFVIERTYSAAAERVFAYLSEPAKVRRWYAESDSHEVESFEVDFRVGGAERSTFRLGDKTPFPGLVMVNEGRFEDIVPNSRIVATTSMTFGARRISTSLICFELFADGDGTKVVLTHKACFYEGADGPQMRKDGWIALLNRLGQVMAN